MLVLASDGIWDNLFDEDILTCLHRPRRDSKAFAEASATCIAELAQTKSQDKSYESPFAKHAKAHGKSYPGGKVDDITVVVSVVKLNP